MPAPLSIRIDAAEFHRRMMTAAKHVPQAMANAINLCLFASRPVIQAELPKVFTIRTPYTAKGVNVTTATKRNLTGHVGFLSSRWWMPSQIEGDAARKKPGDKQTWQPLATGPRSPRPSWNKAMPKSRRPNAADSANAQGYFKILKSSKVFPGIYYRPSDMSRKIKAAFWLEPEERIRPRYDIMATVNRVVAAHWEKAMTQGIKRALETAR